MIASLKREHAISRRTFQIMTFRVDWQLWSVKIKYLCDATINGGPNGKTISPYNLIDVIVQLRRQPTAPIDALVTVLKALVDIRCQLNEYFIIDVYFFGWRLTIACNQC